jgi:hypothetical protein
MLSQIDLTHATRPQQPDDPVSGKVSPLLNGMAGSYEHKRWPSASVAEFRAQE